MNGKIEYNINPADPTISHLIDSFWMVANHSNEGKEIVVLPDGRIDISFSYFGTQEFHSRLAGLETTPTKVIFPPNTVIFVISLNLLAVEYLLKKNVSTLINDAQRLPNDFWEIIPEDLNDFEEFCQKATLKIKALLKKKIDPRKKVLFQNVYISNGSLTVKELSEKASWSSRQMNRYFTQNFGISLKTFCNILRFRASFFHLKEGKLFPEQNFADQAHFIKEVKKLSGVIPKELFKNQNDRFIQFSVLDEK
jgi:AraC-like DNA-binding protein